MSTGSWGRWIPSTPRRVVEVEWPEFVPPQDDLVLPYGLGRSYGDACLNNGHTLLRTARLARFRSFDQTSGVLECDAGTTLDDILRVAVPRGWFLPVTPGTRFVTVGGCIANDVHGKNHHRAGTFGMHVPAFTLQRSNGERLRCAVDENQDLYCATIGGLGLTGLIVSAKIQLRRIQSPLMVVEGVPFRGIAQFAELSIESDAAHEYTVAWLDAFGGRRSRGIFFRGSHADAGSLERGAEKEPRAFPLRPFAPLLTSLTVRAFNAAYFHANARPEPHVTRYEPFFYPLDVVANWNAVYGRRGFLQYQFVIPERAGLAPVEEILDEIASSGIASPLTVVKKFGPASSPGLLSFPQAGTTVSLDFAARRTDVLLALLDRCDAVVEVAGGAVYPAKDARMAPARFRKFFPRWEELARRADPQFSSTFWRRVTR
jgi:FAD/FMN-containing dehydrogenase